ncbi:MAG: hypothetical protein AAFX06_31750 [Planctomycetota bacterium]
MSSVRRAGMDVPVSRDLTRKRRPQGHGSGKTNPNQPITYVIVQFRMERSPRDAFKEKRRTFHCVCSFCRGLNVPAIAQQPNGLQDTYVEDAAIQTVAANEPLLDHLYDESTPPRHPMPNR